MEYKTAKFKGYDFYQSKRGHDYIAITFAILDDDFNEKFDMHYRGYLSEKTIGNTLVFLRSLGWKGYDLRKGLPFKDKIYSIGIIPTIWNSSVFPKIVNVQPFKKELHNNFVNEDTLLSTEEFEQVISVMSASKNSTGNESLDDLKKSKDFLEDYHSNFAYYDYDYDDLEMDWSPNDIFFIR